MRAFGVSKVFGLLLALLFAAQLSSCSGAVYPVMAPPPPPPTAPAPPPPPPPAYGSDETTSGGINPFVNGDVAGSAGPSGPSSAGGVSRTSGSESFDSSPPPPTQIDARDAQIAQEVQGFRPFNVLFNQPTLLPYNKQTLIRFVIASGDIEEAKSEFADTTGAVTTGQAKLGRQVRAQLSGPGDEVQIQIVGTDVRDISTAANTTIDWYVTPKTTDSFKLTLRLYNRVFDGKRWVEVQQPPYVKEFQVSISTSQQLQLLLSEINGWLALLGSSIVALLGLGITRARARFSAKKPDQATPPA